MSTRIAAFPENLEWKQTYMAAVLERGRTRVVTLIYDARKKLSNRLHERQTTPSWCDENKAIHDADYLLQALHNSLSYRDDLEN